MDYFGGSEGSFLMWKECTPPLIVESNSRKVINLLNRYDSDLSEVFFLGDILCYFKNANPISFCNFPREENKAAHELAALASSSLGALWSRKMVFEKILFPFVLERDRML